MGFGWVDVFPSPKSQKTFGVLPSEEKFMLKGGAEQMVVSPGAFATALEKVDKKLTT